MVLAAAASLLVGQLVLVEGDGGTGCGGQQPEMDEGRRRADAAGSVALLGKRPAEPGGEI